MGNNTFARQERISGYRTTQSTEERRLTEQKTALQAAREAEKAAIAARVAAKGSGVPLKEWTDIKDRARQARTRRENLQRDINATQRKIRRLQSRVDVQEKVLRTAPANLPELRAAPDVQVERDVQRARRSRAFRQKGSPVVRIQYGSSRQSITVPVDPVQASAIKQTVRENRAIREREAAASASGAVLVSPGVYELSQQRQREQVTSDAIIRERFGYGGYKRSEILASYAAPRQPITGVVTAATPTQRFYARGGGVPGAFAAGFSEQSQTLKDIRSGRISGFQSMAGTAGVATRGVFDYAGGRLVGYVAVPAARRTSALLTRFLGQKAGSLTAKGLGIATTGGLTTLAALDYARQPTGTKKFDYLISAGGVGTGFTRGYAAGTRRANVYLAEQTKVLAGRQLPAGSASRSLGYPVRYRGVSVREMGVAPTISPATRPFLVRGFTGARPGQGPIQETLVIRGTQRTRPVSAQEAYLSARTAPPRYALDIQTSLKPGEAARIVSSRQSIRREPLRDLEPGARLDEARSAYIFDRDRRIAPFDIGTGARTAQTPWGSVTITRPTRQIGLYSFPTAPQRITVPAPRGRISLLASRRAAYSQRTRPRAPDRGPRGPRIYRELAGRNINPRELIRARPRIRPGPASRAFAGTGFVGAVGGSLVTSSAIRSPFFSGQQGQGVLEDGLLGVRTPISTKLRQSSALIPAQAQTTRQDQVLTFQFPSLGVPAVPVVGRPGTPPPPPPPPPGILVGFPKFPTIQESRGRRRRGSSQPRRSGSGSSLVTILGGRATQGGRSVTGFENRLKPFLYK